MKQTTLCFSSVMKSDQRVLYRNIQEAAT